MSTLPYEAIAPGVPPADAWRLTESGVLLAEEQPGLLAVTADMLATHLRTPTELHPYHISGGGYASVYDIPGHPGQCLKIASWRTMRQARFTPSDRVRPPSNLLTDLDFHHRLGSYFDEHPEHGFSVPVHHAAARTQHRNRRAYGQIMDRLPDASRVVSLLDVVGPLEKDNPDEFYRIHDVMNGRFNAAVGGTALRFGIGDFYLPYRRSNGSREVNARNVFVETGAPIETAKVHLIDMVGVGRSRVVAAGLARATALRRASTTNLF